MEKIPKNAFETQEEDLQDERVIYRHEKDDESFRITRDPDGAYVLTGPQIERLFKMTDFNRDESVRRFARQMRHLGIDEALRKRGAEDGDIVRLLDFEFEFVELRIENTARSCMKDVQFFYCLNQTYEL